MLPKPTPSPTTQPTPTSTSAPSSTNSTTSPTPLITDKTTSWQVYKDKEITFQYPTNWNLEPPGGQELARFITQGETIRRENMNLYQIDNYNQNTKKPFSSLEEIIKWQENSDLITPKEIVAGNQRALWVKDQKPGHVPTEMVSVFSPNKKSIFTFYFYYQQVESNAEQKIQPLFEQILSTLKFLP